MFATMKKPGLSSSRKKLIRRLGQGVCLSLLCLSSLLPLWGCGAQKKEKESETQAEQTKQAKAAPADLSSAKEVQSDTNPLVPTIKPEDLDPNFKSALLEGRTTAEPSKPLDEDQSWRTTLDQMPSKLDPWTNTTSYAAGLLSLLYDPLVKTMTDVKGNTLYYGAACQNIERTKDQLTYLFHLRPEAVWSDGEPVTAQQFVDGFHHLFTLSKEERPTPYLELLQDILNVPEVLQGEKAVDQLGIFALNPTTLMIQLTHPNPNFLSLASLECLVPYRKDKMDAWGDQLGTSPETVLGNGPYLLTAWEKERIEITKNPNYHAAEEYYLSPIEYRLWAAIDALGEFRQGKLDTIDYSEPNWQAMMAVNPHVIERQLNSPSLSFLLCQTKEPPLNHPKLRQALSLCLDRKEINEVFWDNYYLPATGYIPHQIFVGDQEYRSQVPVGWADSSKLSPKDLFLEGMKEVGLGTDPSSLSLSFTTVEGYWYEDLAVYLKDVFKKKIGIELTHKVLPWEDLQKAVAEGKYQLALMGWTSETRDPSSLLTLMTTEGNKDLGLNWSNEEYDSLTIGAKHNPDPAMRLENYKEAEELLLQEMPIIPLAFWRNNYYEMDYIQGTTKDKVDLTSLRGRYISGRKASLADSIKIFEALDAKKDN